MGNSTSQASASPHLPRTAAAHGAIQLKKHRTINDNPPAQLKLFAHPWQMLGWTAPARFDCLPCRHYLSAFFHWCTFVFPFSSRFCGGGVRCILFGGGGGGFSMPCVVVSWFPN